MAPRALALSAALTAGIAALALLPPGAHALLSPRAQARIAANGAAGLGARAPMPFSSISRVLVAAAHPDDIETIAGGLVATLIHDYNVSVAYVVATLGQAGWHDCCNMTREEVGEIRRQEQLNAAAVMGVDRVYFLNQQDGFLEGVDPVELKINMTRVIRTWRPDVLVTFDSGIQDAIDYSTGYPFGLVHRDHLTAGRAALDAAYPMARDWLAAPTLWPAYPTHDTPQVWLFRWGPVPGPAGTDLVLPLSQAAFDLKYNALLQHKSQYTNASDVLASLQALGASVAAANGLAAGVLAEAYSVATIL